MAENDFGLSFSPLSPDGSKPNAYGGNDPQGGGVSPIQQAIQILSIRRPHFFGAQAIAPNALLGGGGGLGGQPDFSAVMQTLMKQFGQQPPGGGFGVPRDQRSGNVYQPPVMPQQPGGPSYPVPNIEFGDQQNPNPRPDTPFTQPPVQRAPLVQPSADLTDRRRV